MTLEERSRLSLVPSSDQLKKTADEWLALLAKGEVGPKSQPIAGALLAERFRRMENLLNTYRHPAGIRD